MQDEHSEQDEQHFASRSVDKTRNKKQKKEKRKRKKLLHNTDHRQTPLLPLVRRARTVDGAISSLMTATTMFTLNVKVSPYKRREKDRRKEL